MKCIAISIFAIYISLGQVLGQCGADCRLCDGSLSACENDASCWYNANNECRVADTCGADCTFCTDTECVNEGAGGGGACFIAGTGPNAGTCVGAICDTNCEECTSGIPSDCTDSRAAPNGCIFSGSEGCTAQTRNPTTSSPTTASPTTASPTTASPTTASPTTSDPTTAPPTTATPTTAAPTQAPLTCGETRNGVLNSPPFIAIIPLDINSDDYAQVIISACQSPDFIDNTLTILDSGDNPIAFDDNGCGDAVGNAEITLDNPSADSYTIVLQPTATSGTEGRWIIEIICDTFNPTNDPTGNPTDDPTTASPTTASPTTADPTTASPTTVSPTTADPTTAEPTTAEPTTADPTTAEPTTAEPTTSEPTTAEPTTSEPTTAEPTTAEPTTAEPTEPDTTTTQVITTTTVQTTGDCPDCPFNITITRIGDIDIEPCPTESPTPSPVSSRKSYWNNRYNQNGAGNWRRRRLTERDEETQASDRLPNGIDLRAQKRGKDRRRLWGGRDNKNNKAWNNNKYNNNWNNNNWNKNNNYNNNWNNNKNYNYNNKKTTTTTPAPTVWLKDRICIDPNEQSGSDRRRLWGYKDKDKDGCNDDEPTPQPTEEPDGFEQWYKEKCPAARDSTGWDSTYNSNGYGSSSKKSSSKYSSRYTSWSRRKEESDEFITEVCVTYTIDVSDGATEDCVDLESVFLGLCENENTDFNSSTLNTDDLEGLIISINGNSTDVVTTNSGDGIQDITGAVDDNGKLGVLITFEDDISGLTTFELCLGNVTVDVDFNDEKDLIEFGNGTIIANDEECTSDGLPCLNFFFDIPCPPETTDDGRDCTCKDGINELTIRYDPANGQDADIAVYRYRRASTPICEFTDVSPGDDITCSDPYGRDLNSNTYVVVNYIDAYTRRRRSTRRRMTYYSKKSTTISGDCVGRFVTDCGVQLIGLTAYDCSDLSVTSYTDEAGQFCDATVLAEADDGSDYNYAFINLEDAIDTPLEVLDDLDPYVKYSLLGVMITFLLLSFVACYICVARNSKTDEEKKKDEIEKAIELAQIDKAKANERVKKYETKLKAPIALTKVNTGEDDDDDDEYYDEDEDEVNAPEQDEEEQFYDDEDMDNMDVLDGNNDQYVE